MESPRGTSPDDGPRLRTGVNTAGGVAAPPGARWRAFTTRQRPNAATPIKNYTQIIELELLFKLQECKQCDVIILRPCDAT